MVLALLQGSVDGSAEWLGIRSVMVDEVVRQFCASDGELQDVVDVSRCTGLDAEDRILVDGEETAGGAQPVSRVEHHVPFMEHPSELAGRRVEVVALVARGCSVEQRTLQFVKIPSERLGHEVNPSSSGRFAAVAESSPVHVHHIPGIDLMLSRRALPQ